jgi:hypothetical protein
MRILFFGYIKYKIFLKMVELILMSIVIVLSVAFAIQVLSSCKATPNSITEECNKLVERQKEVEVETKAIKPKRKYNRKPKP